MQNKNLFKLAKSSKKSQIEDWLPMVLAIVFILFLSITLLFSTKKAESGEIFEFQSAIIDSQEILLDYVKIPFDMQGTQISITDAISLYFSNQDDDILKKIKLETQSYFSMRLSSELQQWSLEIASENNRIIINSKNPVKPDFDKKEAAKITIPSPNFNLIELKLFYQGVQ